MGSGTTCERRGRALVRKAVGAVAALVLSVAAIGVSPAAAAEVPVGVQVAALLAAEGQPSPTWYGWRSAISGDGTTAVIGDGGTDVGSISQAGAVWVYRQAGGTWESTGTVITAPSPFQYDYFGVSVAVNDDGTVLVVGADGWDGPSGYNEGAAYVYRWDSGTGEWAHEQTLAADDRLDYDDFGYSVAMSGDGGTILVGAYGHDLPGATDAGAGYVFRYATGTWSQVAELAASSPVPWDQIGASAALDADGDTAVLATWSDRVHVFRETSGTWGHDATLTDDSPGEGPWLGQDNGVAVSDDGLTVAAAGYVYGGSGEAYVFTDTGDNWQRTELVAPSDTSDQFGYSVAINGAATRVAVGDPNTDGYYGLAYVYDYDAGSSSWDLYATAANTERALSDEGWFGMSLSLSADGTMLLVGNGSGEAFIEGFGAADVPGTPTNPSAAPDGVSGAILTWDPPASDGGSPVLRYRITADPALQPRVVYPPETTASFSGLASGTSYTFSIVAENLAGASSSVTTGAVVTPAVPSAPTAAIAGVANGSVTVEWTAPPSDGGSAITGYDVYVGTTAGGESSTPANAEPLSAATTSYAVSPLTNGTTYYFTVKALNAVGSSAASNEVSATPATVPGAPIASISVVASGSVTVAWTAPSSDGGSAITGYDVYVGTSPGAASTPWNAEPLSAATSSYSIGGLIDGTTYYVTVKALNAMGSGSPSNEVTGIPGPPSTPSAPVPTKVSRGTVSLAWTEQGTLIDGHEVEVYLFKKGNKRTPPTYTYVGTLPTGSASTSFTVPDLKGVYVFRVRAHNGAGWSTRSAYSTDIRV